MSLRYNKSLFAGIFISCCTLAACKKDDAPRPLQSGIYISEKEGDFSSLRLFAQSGEIKDQNLINKYQSKYAQLLTPASSSGASLDTFSVIDENNVKYGSRNFSVTRIDNYYQFRSVDTFRYTSAATELLFNIGKYKPWYTTRAIPNPNGGGNILTTLQYYYAATTANGLVFPMLNMIRFATTNFSGSVSYHESNNTLNNLLDDNFPKELLTYDTLLVQSFNIYYKSVNP